MERVHDDRRPRVTRQQRGGATNGAGLRRVRVEDVRPQPADERREAMRRPQVVQRRDLALEVGEPDDFHPAPFGGLEFDR